jgi:hypothetical protein
MQKKLPLLLLVCVIALSACGPKRYGCGPRRCEMKSQEQLTVPQLLGNSNLRMV